MSFPGTTGKSDYRSTKGFPLSCKRFLQKLSLIHIWLGDERGSITLISVFALIVILGISALVIDVGTFYITNIRLSNGVDAAALAGAQDLVVGATEARATAMEYAEKNGMDSDSIDIYISPCLLYTSRCV